MIVRLPWALKFVCVAAAALSAFNAAPLKAQTGISDDRPLGLLIDRRDNPFIQQPHPAPAARSAQATQPQPTQPQPVQPLPAAQRNTAPAGNGQTDQPAVDGPPVNLLSDEMSFDRENQVISASGNVEITFGDRTLLADRIEYNQKTDIVTAYGNITVLEPSGDTLFAEKIVVTGDFRDALVRNIGLILADRSRLAAHGAKRSGGVVTELRQGVYSPCNLCADDPDAAPLWQIKAVRVIHDERTKTIEYRDAWLEVYGIPVAYTPYFIHPDPSVKRKAGFLTPGFGGSSDLGFVARVPYFYPFNENSDVTVTPAVSEEEGFLLTLQHRHRLKNGKLDTEVSGINDSDDEFRGHISSEGRFNINPTWRAGFDIERSTDDTYLRRFGFESPAVLESRIFAEAFRGRNYLALNGYSFQDLRADAGSVDSPTVLPLIEYSHVGTPDRFGGSFSVDANVLALTRDSTSNDTRRISIRPAWNRRFSDRIGNLFNFSTGIFADGYHVTGVTRDVGGDFSGFTGRVHPYVSLDWRLPLVRDTGPASQVLEPIAQIIASPNGGNTSSIPNEDSQEFEFDHTNLFQVNRFGGIDRVEGGTRVNYGLKWGLHGQQGSEATIFLGQTYRLSDDDTFPSGSGLEDNLSDLVASVRIRPTEHLAVGYRTQLDKDSFSARRHQVDINAGVPLLTVTGTYFFFERQAESEFGGREELSLGITSQMSRNWKSSVNLIRDIATDEMRSISSSLAYENECIVVTTRFSRTFFSDRDLEPTDAFTINILLKTLGQVSF